MTVLPFRAPRQPVTPAEPHQEPPAVYTIQETARLLAISPGSAYRLARTGQIPAVRLGGRWVVPKRRLHDWLNQPTTDTHH
ncbi:helix-turn-helix domain-containing protein [Solwaraspora sp. WMMD791]|uniref:helix-turn-helix domain-containing protein n=1 Tax=Solwaraspora sp. WMMD791 TaxID=3016086 RepID=UPI00249BF0D9|nr:helix-turn-helix domain-containing protein [Solwaraspora sp. WMMD791]WFE27792.1 helix-turn-helix domain-containing protein [Solwaraspora sp. WMMD791]